MNAERIMNETSVPSFCRRKKGDTTVTRQYELYVPEIERHDIYREDQHPEYRFSHMIVIEHFDGRFHAVWNNGHGPTHWKLPPQRMLWATSPDGREWSAPARITETKTETPLDKFEDEVAHWQPSLLNVRGETLWCLWSATAPRRPDGSTMAGTYMSTLGKGPGAKWRHRRLFEYVDLPRDGRAPASKGLVFPSQKAVMLSSGRVVQPVTLIRDNYEDAKYVWRRCLGSSHWNAAMYTDDDGASWHFSNAVLVADEERGMWEPHVIEQADGRLRMFMRYLTWAPAQPPPTQRMRTTVGTGVAKGKPLIFEPDVRPCAIETISCRPQVVKLPCGRYCMFMHDLYDAVGFFMSRSNQALFFSRTGEDDFVAGPGIYDPQQNCHYAQGIVHGGKIYVGYTYGRNYNVMPSATSDRGIGISIISPLPEKGMYYIWPRNKDMPRFGKILPVRDWTDENGAQAIERLNPNYVYQPPYRERSEGREALVFKDRGCGGVEIDPVDFAKGETLAVSFEFFIRALQDKGSLILCSFGGESPIRIGVPSNRPGRLHIHARGDWHEVGAVRERVWERVDLRFGADEFSVRLGKGEARVFANPIRCPDRRLYLGDGYEVDPWESNRGSEFLIDLPSLRTSVVRAQ